MLECMLERSGRCESMERQHVNAGWIVLNIHLQSAVCEVVESSVKKVTTLDSATLSALRGKQRNWPRRLGKDVGLRQPEQTRLGPLHGTWEKSRIFMAEIGAYEEVGRHKDMVAEQHKQRWLMVMTEDQESSGQHWVQLVCCPKLVRARGVSMKLMSSERGWSKTAEGRTKVIFTLRHPPMLTSNLHLATPPDFTSERFCQAREWIIADGGNHTTVANQLALSWTLNDDLEKQEWDHQIQRQQQHERQEEEE
ncbi:hypothetical protein EDD15DRAFT_2191377 [Pisolithus albus]|nr:hypothetical protein EDD15DRAFT_2191377 [Pisolithus albus]